MASSDNQAVVITEPKDPPREKMINTAVTFLKLEKVKASPLKNKQEFLRSKGLTDEEVRIACEIAGAFKEPVMHIQDISNMPGDYTVVKYNQYGGHWFYFTRDVVKVALFLAGLYYVSKTVYQKYLSKYFNKDNSKKPYDDKKNMMSVIANNVTEHLVLVESKISELDDKLGKLVQNQESQDLENQYNCKQIDDLKHEVLSLKGLLLNRKQFPQPTNLPSGVPSIPAWQLKADSPKSTSSHQDSMESNESNTKHTPDNSEGSEPEIISKDNGSNGSDSSLEIVNK